MRAVRVAIAPLLIALGCTVACNAIVGFGDLEKTPLKSGGSSSSGGGDDDEATSSTSSGKVGSSSGAASSSGAGTSTSSGVVVTPKCDPAKPFGAAVSLGDKINTSAFEDGGSLTADELTIVFMRASDNTHAQVMMATRATIDAPFGDPAPVAAPGNTNLWPPWISSDGLTLYWSVLGNTMDVFMSSRASKDAAFTNKDSSPFQNNNYDEFRPASTAGGNEMFFLANKNAGSGGLRAWHSLKNNGTFGPISELTELTADGQDGSLAISGDGLTMYFASDRTGSTNNTYDVYVARRDNRAASFGGVTRVAEVSTDKEDVPSFISNDGCRLYLGSNRSGSGDLFVATKPL